ncbi:helix-turn-helix domain-containing protein [Hydrogenivirga sp.]
MRELKPIMKTEELAELLGESPASVRMKVYRGQLPARRLGRRLIFLREELEDYLKKLPSVIPKK